MVEYQELCNQAASKRRRQFYIIFVTISFFLATGIFGGASPKILAFAPTSTPSTAKSIEVSNIANLTKLAIFSQKGVDPTWSHDGKELAILGESNIYVYDVTNPNIPIITLRAEPVVDTIMFSPDDTLLVAGNGSAIEGNSSQVLVWDLSTGKLKTQLKNVYRPLFDPTSKRLLVLDVDTNGVIVWDVVANKLDFALKSYRVPAFGPDNSLLAVAGFPPLSNSVVLWNLSTNNLVTTLQGKQDGSFLDDLSISADGHYLAAGEDNGSVRLWDLKTLALLPVWTTTCAQRVDFGLDASTLIIWSDICDLGEKDNIQVWQPTIPRKLWGLEDPFNPNITSSQDGSLIVVEDLEQHIWIPDKERMRFLDKFTGQEIFSLQDVDQPEFSLDDTLLVTGSPNGTIELWGIK